MIVIIEMQLKYKKNIEFFIIENMYDTELDKTEDKDIMNTIQLANDIIKRHQLRGQVSQIRGIKPPQESDSDEDSETEMDPDLLSDEAEELHQYLLRNPRDKRRRDRLTVILNKLIELELMTTQDKKEIFRTIDQ